MEKMEKLFLALGLIVFIGIIWFAVRGFGDESVSLLPDSESSPVSESEIKAISPEDGGPETGWRQDEQAIFEALVVLRDQTSEDPAEDRKTSLKRGDVLAVRISPQEWSETEWKSYLIVKVDLKGSEATALLDPKMNGDQVELARKSRIDLDQAGFQGDQVLSGQPLLGKTFGKEIIIQK